MFVACLNTLTNSKKIQIYTFKRSLKVSLAFKQFWISYVLLSLNLECNYPPEEPIVIKVFKIKEKIEELI